MSPRRRRRNSSKSVPVKAPAEKATEAKTSYSDSEGDI